MVIDVDLLCGEKTRMLDVMKVGKKLGLIMRGRHLVMVLNRCNTPSVVGDFGNEVNWTWNSLTQDPRVSYIDSADATQSRINITTG